jgi:predicted HD phosphohydrolase
MHDIGHLVHNPGDDPAAQGIDDQHEDVGNEWLARAFGRT